MIPFQQQQQGPSINSYERFAMNLVYNFCSVFTIPIEMLLRPAYGTRYFPPVVMFFTAILMMLLPLFSQLGSMAMGMVPFMRPAPVFGMFDIGTISQVYFVLSFVHGLRLWWKMTHVETERISTYEGPPLPFFRVLPGGFWIVRVIYEPLFVFALGAFLPRFLLQPSASNFLMFSAVMLAGKQYVAWYGNWQAIREILDTKNIGPLIAKFVDNTATKDELATIHLASLPKNLPEDVRRETAAFIARTISPHHDILSSTAAPEASTQKKGIPGLSRKDAKKLKIAFVATTAVILLMMYLASFLDSTVRQIRQHFPVQQKAHTK
jgi:hypothetical protein